MFARLSKLINPIKYLHQSSFNKFFRPIHIQNVVKRSTILAFPTVMMFNQYLCIAPMNDDQKKQKTTKISYENHSFIQQPKTFWQKIRSFFAHLIRLIQLLCIYMPPILLLPLKFFKLTQKIWLSLFVKSVQKAGVVWIKAFQYLSHRRDVIGPQMSQVFAHLRQNAPTHSFQLTKQTFKKKYGKEIEQIFDQFDKTPIASGSVSQVYKAIYKGNKVAVKVRHPQVQKHIQRDVNILFGISKFLSIFSKSYQIPVGQQSLKKTLIDQIDFNVQKDNLNTFNHQFRTNKYVYFPQAISQLTRDSILIQTFAQGVPVTHFQNNRHPLNAVIARLGATTFFQMLFKNNFIHADCHGGNILVEVTKQIPTFFGQIYNYLTQKWHTIQQKIIQFYMQSDSLRNLYRSSRQQQKRIRQLQKNSSQKVKLNLIDAGMVIQLKQQDKINFGNFIKSILEGNSQKCANLIFKLSNFDGKKIIQGKFKQYKQQLLQLFSILDKKSIFDIEGMQLLIGMLNIIRQNNMKLDGQFATLLTNICVLQSIAKDIDPNIQILKCAVPYFKYVQETKDINIQEISSHLL